jgi:fatty acid desaturase
MPTTPIRQPTLEERGAELAAFDRAMRREAWRDRARFALACFAAVALGFGGMGLGVAMRDPVWGPVVFWGGYLAGTLVWLGVVIWGYQRARERGDL